MGKILVLAEKPSVAKELARVLNCNQHGTGCFMGSKYIVTWALGHLVTLADPEVYSNKYKSWNLEDLPMIPKRMELVVIKDTSKQYNSVRNLLKRDDIDELVIATDAGREGELVARWIVEKANFRKPMKRLWISSQTDKAIKEGFSKLRPSREYDNLYRSAESRAEADWLIGLNVTRALTCKYNAQLSAGRVQTPTLAMIVKREEEIRKFIPKDYYTISGVIKGFTVNWMDKKSNNTQIFNRESANLIADKVNNKDGNIIEVVKDYKKELPPLAYDLTELQREANSKYGFSAKQTLSTMQSLYERHKLLTYPRTDSRHISSDIVESLSDRLKSIAIGPYKEMAREVLRNKIEVSKRFVDNSKVTDHHAIIPTEQFVDLNALNAEEKKIYDLVVKRFIAVLSKPFEYEQTTVKLEVNNELFTAKGKIVKAKGWKSVYNNDGEEKDQSLPEVKKGEAVKLINVRVKNDKTKPPARYTEATLLSAMEHPGKFIEDEKMREVMDKTSGLGTPATRADIIEKLFSTFYLERRGKDIYPTSKGMQLIDLVPQELKSPELTAKWEEKLLLISKGNANPNAFLEDMRSYASKLVSAVITSSETYKHDNLSRVKCPECGEYLLEVKGKKGNMLVCKDRECGYRKGVSQVSNARCPQCHKKMEIKGEGDKKLFTCSCGYREKLEAFNKRRSEEKSNVNKKDISKYLKEQKQDEPINNALAEALAKWNKN